MCSTDFDYEPCELWQEITRRARKGHECDSCGGVIRSGDHYLHHFHLLDGDPGNEKMCAGCWFIRHSFVEAHGSQSFLPSMLIGELQSCITDSDEEDEQWRPALATVLQRYRRSRSRLARLRKARVADA